MELVTRNVAAQVKAPPLIRDRRPDLTVEDAKRLLNSIRGERLEAFFVLAFTTGLRRGELLALRWEDVDLSSRQLRVRQALQRADGKLRMVESKTTTSRRTVVLPKLAIRHLREHRKRQTAQRLKLGEARREHGLVFASTIGTPIEPRNINRRWDELRERAGLDGSGFTTCGTAARRSCSPREGTLTGDHGSARALWDQRHDEHLHTSCLRFARRWPTRSMSCSGHEDGLSGSSCGRCKIAMGLR
jgi:integrase